jgi:galactoside O-acetyltransferase
MLLKKGLVYTIDFLMQQLRQWRLEVKLHNYRRIAQIGVNFCQAEFNPLCGENLLIFNRAPREHVLIGDNVLLDCKINCNRNGHVSIGKYTSIREHSVINCDNTITIGDFCFIGNNVIIQDNDSHPESPTLRQQQSLNVLNNITDTYGAPNAPITIANRVWIGTGATILKGVAIGEGAIIGTGAIVTRSVPAMSLAAGNPARVLRTIQDDPS